MYASGEAPKLGGDAGIRTAYFTDIQGFSTFSEKLTATKLVELLNEYLSVMTDILIEEQGTLDKYEGDAIIAFFGAPMPLPDHATRAVRVALRMQNALGDLRQKWTNEGNKWPKIVHDMRMRIGINSGEIVTGNMGSKLRMNYTMMGDAVNLAARLEESAKQYGIFIQISHFTYELVKDAFDCREIDTIRVVGKSEPITTYEPLGMKGQTPELLQKLQKSFALGLIHYKNQEWDLAIEQFKLSSQLELERFPELSHKTNPSKIYLARCEHFKLSPPPNDWDGVYTLTEK
jgi:adenylate cyclase